MMRNEAKRTVLITGGTGTISSGLAEEFCKHNYSVTCITRGNMRWRQKEHICYVYADVKDAKAMSRFLADKEFDIVIDCLAYTLEDLKRSLAYFYGRCKKYVFISSTAVYRRNKDDFIMEDNFEELTEWGYARNKIICEKYLNEWGKEKGFEYIIIRPPVVYGDYRVPFPVISRKNQWTIWQRMIDSKPIINNNVEPVRYCVLHISDFSKAVRLLVENKKASWESFHIADKNALFDWDDILRVAAAILKTNVSIIHVALPVFKETFPALYDELKWNKNQDLLLDDSKLYDLTGFRANITLEEGIESNIRSLREEYTLYNKLLDDEYNLACDQTILRGMQLGLIPQDDIQIVRKLRDLDDIR